MNMMPSYWRDRITAFVVLGLAALAFSHIWQLPAGAALFPTLNFALAGALAVILFALTFFPRLRLAETKPFFQNIRNFSIAVGVTLIYLAHVSVIGYFTATSIYMLVLAYLLGYRRPRPLLLGTAAFIASVYGVFVLLFSRPLPVEFFINP